MTSLAAVSPAADPAPPPDVEPDYCARALALWPRLDGHRLARVRRDPRRVAALVSRRTTLSKAAILELIGAPHADPVVTTESGTPNRDH